MVSMPKERDHNTVTETQKIGKIANNMNLL